MSVYASSLLRWPKPLPRPPIIAEAATNHGGDEQLMLRLIEEAASAGANYIKFQLYDINNLRPGDPQWYWFLKSQLTEQHVDAITVHALEHRIIPLFSVFDVKAAERVVAFDHQDVKIGSGEIHNVPLIEYCLGHFNRVYLSLGCATEEDFETVHAIVKNFSAEVTYLHCVSHYPTKPQDANLAHIWRLKKRCKKAVGWSDHSVGIEIAKVALAMGADVIEKHFSVPGGREQAWNMQASELRELVQYRNWLTTVRGVEGSRMPTPQAAQFIGRWEAKAAQ